MPQRVPRRPARPAVAAGGLLVALVLLPGCLVSSNNWTEVEGTRIAGHALDRVVVGETTEDWILATFGDPTSRSDLEDGTTVLRYESRTTRSGRGTVFLLFAGSSRTTTTNRTVFELQDGVVRDWWVESSGS